MGETAVDLDAQSGRVGYPLKYISYGSGGMLMNMSLRVVAVPD